MDYLKVTQENGVLNIRLNRPEKRNAFFPPMIVEIIKTFRQASRDQNLRVVVLSAEGPSFCAGGDLEWMKSMAGYSLAQNKRDADQLFELYWTIRSCPVPVVGRVFGHCFGGGIGLVAVCDMAAGEEQTQFCFSEVKWGLVPAVISPFVREKVAAGAALSQWFLTAQVFDAAAAMKEGLINFRGPILQVDEWVKENVNLVLSAAPQAVRDSKRLLQAYSPIQWKSTRSRVVNLIAKRRVSREGQTGLQAFLSKKTPDWSVDG